MTTCTRCQGLMLEEHRIEMDEGEGEMWSFSWRCFSCGHRDETMQEGERRLHAKQVEVSLQTVMVQEAFGMPWKPEEIETLAA